jgi:hypothetical protein
MVHKTSVEKIQKSYKQNSKQPIKNYSRIIFSSLVSAIFAITITLLLAVPIVRQESSGQQAVLGGRLSSIEPVNNTVAAEPNSVGVCEVPSGSFGGGTRRSTESKSPAQVVESKASNGNGGKGGGNNIVEQFLSENKTSNRATISNTGANSINRIAQVTKNITTEVNTNTVNASVDNPQVATSGNVTNSENTSSGTISSGSASNDSRTSFMFTINNRN